MERIRRRDGAGPIWSSIMNQITAQSAVSAPTPPPLIVVAKQGEARSSETPRYFIAGTEPQDALGTKPLRPRFLYPPNGLVLGFDPDIRDNQKLVIRRGTQGRRTGYSSMVSIIPCTRTRLCGASLPVHIGWKSGKELTSQMRRQSTFVPGYQRRQNLRQSLSTEIIGPEATERRRRESTREALNK